LGNTNQCNYLVLIIIIYQEESEEVPRAEGTRARRKRREHKRGPLTRNASFRFRPFSQALPFISPDIFIDSVMKRRGELNWNIGEKKGNDGKE